MGISIIIVYVVDIMSIPPQKHIHDLMFLQVVEKMSIKLFLFK